MLYSFCFDRIMAMKVRPPSLPHNPQALWALVREQESQLAEREARIARLSAEQAALEKTNEALALRVRYAEIQAEVLQEKLNLALAH